MRKTAAAGNSAACADRSAGYPEDEPSATWRGLRPPGPPFLVMQRHRSAPGGLEARDSAGMPRGWGGVRSCSRGRYSAAAAPVGLQRGSKPDAGKTGRITARLGLTLPAMDKTHLFFSAALALAFLLETLETYPLGTLLLCLVLLLVVMYRWGPVWRTGPLPDSTRPADLPRGDARQKPGQERRGRTRGKRKRSGRVRVEPETLE